MISNCWPCMAALIFFTWIDYSVIIITPLIPDLNIVQNNKKIINKWFYCILANNLTHLPYITELMKGQESICTTRLRSNFAGRTFAHLIALWLAGFFSVASSSSSSFFISFCLCSLLVVGGKIYSSASLTLL